MFRDDDVCDLVQIDLARVRAIRAALTGADALVIVTEWDMFRALDLLRVRSLLAKPNFIDLRNIYDPVDVEAAGLRFTGIGRGTTNRPSGEPDGG